MNLRIATFNVRNGDADDGANSWPLRKNRLSKFLRDLDADILGLQEVMAYQLDFILGELGGYQAVGVGRIDGKSRGEFAPILYRKPLNLVTWGYFWLSESPEIAGSASWDTACERICTWAQFDSLKVANTHLDHISGLAREMGIRLVLERVGDSDLVVGDFNSLPSEPPVQLMREAGFFDLGEQSPDSTFHDWGRIDGGRIDFLFAGSRVRGVGGRLARSLAVDGYVSDHHAVVAEIDVL
jgi:endonuclease/exonuclease/phosphatase family metal-dependent hydrolase